MAATLVAVAIVGVIFVSGSSANLAPSTFEGNDGNLVVNSGTDWASFPISCGATKVGCLVDTPSGSSDNAFGQGTAEDDTNVTVVDGSIPPNKNDLTRSYIATEVVGPNTYLYLSWERSFNTGSANIDFELNQNTTPGFDGSTGSFALNRTAGDILIAYDFGGSGTPTISLLRWVTTGPGSLCDKSNTTPCWGTRTDLTALGFAEAAVNTVAVSDPFLSATPNNVAVGLFGEAALNLSSTELHVFEPNTCRAFGNMFVKSRASGSSIDAELKDFIAPVPIHVSNCGSIELKKHWVGTAGSTTLNIGTSAGGNQTATQAVSGGDGTTGAKEVDNGNYFVSEDTSGLANYTTTLSCSDNGGAGFDPGAGAIPVSAGHQVVCTYTNTRKQGTIKLGKHWVGTPGNASLAVGSAGSGSANVATGTANGADGDTGTHAVDTGTYYVSEQFDSNLYTTSLACFNDANNNGVNDQGDSPVTAGANGDVAVGDGQHVICVYTNTRKQGSIELTKTWSGTKGNVTLKIGSSAGGSQVDSQALVGANGTTGANTVDTGTYYVSESFDSPSSAGDYTTTLACTDNGQPVTPGASDSVAVAAGHTVVCGYTNTRKQGTIELKKSWVGIKGNVTLKIGTSAGGTQVDSQALVGADGTTGANTVDTGTYFVAESFDSPTNASDYTTTLACTDNGTPVTPGASDSVAVTNGHAIVCTYTNSRKPGTIELTKTWNGTKGNVTLNIGTSAGGNQVDTQALVGANGTTGTNSVAQGTYFVAESFDSPTNASDYTTTLACTDNGQPVTPGANNSVTVTSNHAVVCAFTNTRKQGTIELIKTWSGTKGNVTLKIGTAAGGSQVDSQALVGANGTTGANTVDTGTYFVAESFDSPTNASDYTTTLACTDNGQTVTPGASDSVSVTNGHAIVCTYTNTRKQGTIELKKTWPGTKGNVTLKIGTSAGGTQVDSQALVGANGTTGVNTVDTGTYFVAESFDSPTNPADYTTTLDCTDNGAPVTPGASDSLAVTSGHAIVCTYTNTRKTGTIELKKTWNGTKGNVTLKIGTSAGGTQVDSQALIGANGTTGTNTVDTGTYFVAESFDPPTNASDYTTTLDCTDNGQPVTPGASDSLAVGSGHVVICTYTNTRKAGSIELIKSWVGIKGNVTLKIGTSAGGTQVDSQALVGADGTTGANTVDTGTYFVAESFDSPTSGSDYDTTLACTDNGQPVTPGASNSLAVTNGHAIVCTFTNTRRPGSIELKKTWVGTKGDVTLAIGTSVAGSEVDSQELIGVNGTTGANSVAQGTYYVSEVFNSPSSADDYTTTLACTDNGQTVAPGASNSLSVLSNHTVVCTFTNTRKQGSIELRKTWSGTKGNVTLKIGTSAGGTQVDSQALVGANGTTGTNTVDTGTYYVAESFDSPTNGSDYTTTLACTDNGQPVTPGAADSLAVGNGHVVICTYTNTRKTGSIELKKTWNGTKGNVTLKIGTSAGGTQVDSQALVGANGTTGANTVDTGTYFVAESFDSPTNPADYTTTLDCTDNGQPVTPGAGDSLAVGNGDVVVCTYTNTRKAGSIELKKTWSGTKGNVTLKIGTSAGGTQVDSQALVGADGTTGINTVDTGTYFVAESFDSPTNASDYTTTLDCTDNGQPVTPGASSSLAVTDGHAIVCTFTNTRKAGSIELKKTWSGTKGNVTLKIGTSAGGSQVDSESLVGANGTTGANTVDTGTYYVAESFDSPTNASDYTTTLDCTDNGQPVTPGAGSSLAVGNGDVVVCTYTNTRKTGTIEVKKTWAGIKGNVTLKIGTTAGGGEVDSQALVGADGTTGQNTVDTGTYYVAESFDSPTNASDYTTTLACTDNGQPVTPGTDSSLAVANGHAIVCTYTNTRKPGTIELVKTWVGTKGDVTLKIGTESGASDVASKELVAVNGTTGAKSVDQGTYFVSEVFNSPSSADDYTTTLACTDNGAPVTPGQNSGLAVASTHTVVCTFTNTRKTGSIELRKTWVGDKGNVTLKVGTTSGGSQVASQTLVGADGTTGPKTVDSGTYFVAESFDTPTKASDYTTTLDCTDNGKPVTPSEAGGLPVDDGHAVVCTFTNKRLPQLKLVKNLQPSNDSGRFNFSIDQQSFTNGGNGYGDGGTTGFVSIQPGAPVISEIGNGNTKLSDYDSSISCSNDEGGSGTSLDLSSLTYGDQVTCTFTNVRHGRIEIVKHTLGGAGTFGFTLTRQGAEGSTPFQLSPAAGADDSKQFDVSPGDFSVVEAAQAGWTLTGLSCSTGGSVDESNAAKANIHIGAGDFVTCTYTNTKLATLVVKKVVDNSNGGGTKTPADFSLHVTTGGLDVSGSPAAGTSTGTTYTLLPGTYKVGEGSVSGYNLTKIDGCLADGSITLEAGQTATCTLTNTSNAPPPPPPPPPPAPRIDLQITKSATPNPVTVGNQVTWTMVVTNNGPNTAHGVTAADPVPAGMTFVSATSTQGTCTGGALVNCTIGTMNVGASVTITLVTTAAATGTITNTATTVGTEQETNTANNTASANVVVNGVFTPPVVYCTAVTVSPKQLFVGRKNTLTMKLTSHGQAKAGVKVKIKGSTLNLTTKASNARGSVKQTVKPMKAGIVVFQPVATKSCKNPRIGVIGVFTPPVTG